MSAMNSAVMPDGMVCSPNETNPFPTAARSDADDEAVAQLDQRRHPEDRAVSKRHEGEEEQARDEVAHRRPS